MDDMTPAEEVMQTLLKFKNEGKIRAIGLSNATIDHLNKYKDCGPVDSDQERYSLFDRAVETSNIPCCVKHGMAFIAYSPLFHGLLAGKFSGDTRFEPGDFRATRQRFAPDYIEKVNAMLKLLEPIKESHATSAGALVLAYMLCRPGCTHVLVGARKTVHAAENAQAGRLTLSVEDLKQMDNIFLRHLPVLSVNSASGK